MDYRNMDYVKDYYDDDVSLEIYECNGCGFHIGLDFTYLEQCDDIEIDCPSCGLRLSTNYYKGRN